MTNSLSSIPTPSLLQSAEASLQGGFNLLDQGAAEIVGATVNPPQQSGPGVILDARLNNAATDASAQQDPLLQGIFDTITAQAQVGAGAALLHVYNRTRDDLLSLIAPEPACGSS